MRTSLDFRANLALIVLCGSWGLNQVAIKVTLWGIPPALQMGARSLLASVLVLLWCGLRGIPVFRADGTLWPGLLVGTLFGLEFLLLFFGLQWTTASRGVLLLYIAPFVVAVGAHFALGEPLSRVKLAGLVAAFLGVMLTFADSLSLPTRDALLGDVFCVLAAFAWGLSTIVVKGSRLRRIAAEKTLLYQLGMSALIGFVLAVALRESVESALVVAVLPAFLYQAIWVAAITYVAWFALMREYPASLLAAFTFLTPVFGVAFGAAVLGEPLSPVLLAALLLVAVGIYLVNRSSAQRRPALAS